MKQKYQNRVCLKGVVIRKVSSKDGNTSIITVKIRAHTDKSDRPDIYFFGDSQKLIEDIEVGDRVEVEARYKSKPVDGHTDESGKTRYARYKQGIIAESIKKQASLEEEAGAKSGHLYNDENNVVLQGRVVSCRLYGDDRVSVILQTGPHMYTDRIAFSVFPKANANEAVAKFPKDKNMLVLGKIQTLPPKDKKRKKETIIVRSFSVQGE